MATGLTPIRRVVTGNDARGRSKVVWDGPAPGTHPMSVYDRGHTDLWVWNETPAPLSLDRDDGTMPDDFPGPPNGGHLRVVHWRERSDETNTTMKPFHEAKPRPGGRTWDRGGGNNLYSSAMHKTESVDYGIILTGERAVILDDCELLLKPGDIIVQVGAWHQWDSSKFGCLMAFDMISARFVDGPGGLAQGHDPVMRADPARKLPQGVKPTRRVVTIDREPGKSSLVSDGPSPDVQTDPARPGFASARIWITDSAPARIVYETLHLPYAMEPPPRGSLCRVVTLPGRHMARQSQRRRSQSVFQRDGVTGRIHLLAASAASLYAEDAHSRLRLRHRRRDHTGIRYAGGTAEGGRNSSRAR